MGNGLATVASCSVSQLQDNWNHLHSSDGAASISNPKVVGLIPSLGKSILHLIFVFRCGQLRTVLVKNRLVLISTHKDMVSISSL